MAASAIPWGATGWKGIQVAHNALPGFEAPGYDDSAWPEIALPIGGGTPTQGPSDNLFCPIHYEWPPATSWDMGTDFLLRRTVTGTDFTLAFAVDNEARIYFDGVLVGTYTNLDPGTGDACPERTDHAPASGELGAGDHVLAIRARDYADGGESYFDCQLTLTVGSGFIIGRVGIGPGAGGVV